MDERYPIFTSFLPHVADESPVTSGVRRRLRVLLARPRGFCAGVERAIDIVERALERYGPPVYVRHEIVHNRHVVESLRRKGAVFVRATEEIPKGAIAIFSAHGVAARVEEEARARSLRVIDATCPLVTKVHKEGQRYAGKGYEVVLIGHAGHPEVEGTLGRIDGKVHLIATPAEAERVEVADPTRVAYVTQTTLSVDDTRAVIEVLARRFPGIAGPSTRDICYATQNRQTAARALAAEVDVLLVVGAPHSSNSTRLQEIGAGSGIPSYLIEDADGLDPAWLDGARSVGITAGASAPHQLVEGLVDRLHELFVVELETLPGIEEGIRFRLPAELERTLVDQ